VGALKSRLSLAVLVAAIACRRSPVPETRVDGGDLAPHFDAAPYFARAKVPAMAYAAVTRDEELMVGAVGMADPAHGAIATVDTRFESASIAKTVIATCVMQLVERGTLALDEDVSKYLPFRLRHPPSGAPLSLRLLLSHHGSIHDDEAETSEKRSKPLGVFLEGYLTARGRPRARAFSPARPGTRYEYSNVGAALAAYAVETTAARSFDEHSMTAIFRPLKMRSTSWALASGDAVPHALREGRHVPLPNPSHALYPVVDLASNVRDLVRLARAILRGGELDGARILSPASVDAMLSSQEGDPEQALGWQLRVVGGVHVVGHEGEDVGASSALFLDPSAGVGAIVLTNGDAFASGDEHRTGAIASLVEDLLARARSRGSRARDGVSSTDAN
jgi:CubicO group peptidase (beta-lactamase class C family)